MTVQDISLDDKFDLTKTQVLLNGTQALVRLMITQQALDARAGLNTAGFVTGYRGSPLGAVDMQMRRAKAELDAANVRFQEGLNEDLAATALWGSQQAELRGEGKFDGVFGLWYGKGPGWIDLAMCFAMPIWPEPPRMAAYWSRWGMTIRAKARPCCINLNWR